MIPRISKRYASTPGSQPKPPTQRSHRLYCGLPADRMTLTGSIRPLGLHPLRHTGCHEYGHPHVLATSNFLEPETADNARWLSVGSPDSTRDICRQDPKNMISALNQDTDMGRNLLPFIPRRQGFRLPISNGTLSIPKFAHTGQQARAFHASAHRAYPSGDSYHSESVVPNFYVKHKTERKKHAEDLKTSSSTPSTASPSPTDASGLALDAADPAPHEPAPQTRAAKRRKHDQSSLMHHLSDSIIGDDLVASTRRLVSKIPVEHYDKDGYLVHPSGFVVPGKGHSSTSNAARAKEQARDEDEDRATQTAAVAERVLESDLDHVHSAMASTRPRSHKVPFEIREPDGTVKHPSGFVPPTPANEFKYSDSASLERGLSGAISRQRARDAENKKSKFIQGRGLYTSAVEHATEKTFPTYLMQPVPLGKIVAAGIGDFFARVRGLKEEMTVTPGDAGRARRAENRNV